MSKNIKIMKLIQLIQEDLGKNELIKKNLIIEYIKNISFRLTINYRIGSYLYKKKNKINKLIVLILKNKQLKIFSSSISYKSQIEGGVKFIHPIGIVIGDGVTIGKNAKIWQQVTIGSDGKNDGNKKYPQIGDNVYIYAGAKIIGNIYVGNNVKIGANSVVLKDIPDNRTAVGIPAKIIDKNEKVS